MPAADRTLSLPESLPESSVEEIRILATSLLECLGKETQIYRQFIEVMKAEREILRKPSLETLSANNLKKERCLSKASHYERKRLETMQKLRRTLALGSNEELDPDLISSCAGIDIKQQLRDGNDALFSLAREVKDRTSRNKGLLKDYIACSRKTLLFTQKLTSSTMNYLSSGRLSMALPNGRLVNREG